MHPLTIPRQPLWLMECHRPDGSWCAVAVPVERDLALQGMESAIREAVARKYTVAYRVVRAN